MAVMQGKAWLRQRPHVVAIIALALLGSAGLVSTFGGPLRRSALGKHKRLMAQGVPESLMRVNITATYADNFCKSSAPSNLTTQHWMDGPICQRGNSTLKVRKVGWQACIALFTNWHTFAVSCSVMIQCRLWHSTAFARHHRFYHVIRV